MAAAVPALASDPATGTVSTASPKVEWTGTSNAYGVYPLQGLASGQAGQGGPCEQPACDTFALEVADQANLTLTADNNSADGPGSDSVQMDVTMPDGTVVYTQSEPDKPVLVRLKNAAKGSYTIDVWVNQRADADGTFKASAVLGSTAPAPAPSATPAPGGQPAPAPAPAQEPAATLSLKTTKASAKKVKKALKLSIGSSKPVTDVQASLKKGSKVLGSAKLASMGTSGTLKLKLKKVLKKGAYTVVLTAKDGDRSVGLTAKLTVKK
jgi:hypothetical protein